MRVETKPYLAYTNFGVPAPCLRQADSRYGPGHLKMGLEINLTSHFYKPKALRYLEEIRADLLAVEKQAEGLLEEILGRNET